MSRKRKRKKWKHAPEPNISREELQAMHEAVNADHPRPGHEGYSLLCSLGACLGMWPRVKRTKVEELRQRFRDFQRPDGRNA